MVIRSLPLITLYLTERCNSRCVSCDYWRHGRVDMTPASVARLLPELRALGTRTVLISGGEPLIHPQWIEIAQTLRTADLELWLLTSGLSLVKHARAAAELFERITVSLDGADRTTYEAIRGLDAFDNVCAGIRAAAGAGAQVGVRVTVQRRNFRELSALVVLARTAGARQISFLAADILSREAFGRAADYVADIAMHAGDLGAFARVLDGLERDHARDFESGFIAESPLKLRRLWQYYAATCGQGEYPPTCCNAPEFSAVVEANGRIDPCFFIRGPADATDGGGLRKALNDAPLTRLRGEIRAGRRPECTTCVCSMWRDPDTFALAPPRPPIRARLQSAC
ncbi:MAG: radical SAM/SPASM domain-containing protein [Terriglobales bacterium]